MHSLVALLLLAQADSLQPCVTVPAAVVGPALGVRVVNAVHVRRDGDTYARCRYHVRIGADTTTRIYFLYVQADSDYDGLHEAIPESRNVPGVGDAAHTYVDPDTKRTWLTAVKRGRICVTVTADDFDSARKLAILALSRYR